MQALVESVPTNARTSTSVVTAIDGGMSVGPQTVPKRAATRIRERRSLKTHEVQPRYACNFLWEEDRRPTFLTSADISEYAPPLPDPPPRSLFSSDFLHTLNTHSHLFCIVIPINVDKLEYFLLDHPNRAFVLSICHMMREGAWPWASVPPTSFLPYNDQLQDISTLQRDLARLDFFNRECQKEVDAGR